VHNKAADGKLEHLEPRRVFQALKHRVPGHPADGVSIGWTPDGQPLGFQYATMNRGALVSGTNGSGKTNLLELLLFDAAVRNRPALVVDFKGSESLIGKVRRLGGVVWSYDTPSPKWNPTQGNASEVAAKVTAVEGTQTGNQWNTVTAGYVQLAVRAMLEAGVATDPATLAALLNPPELERFIGNQAAAHRLTGKRSGELLHELSLATDKEAGFDVRPLGGVASRMRGVIHGEPAPWLGQPDPGEPYLDVLEAIRAGRIVLFSINANRYGLPARRLGAWVLAEAMRVGASLGSAWGEQNRCLFLIDEFSSLEEYGGSIAKVLAVARENGVATGKATTKREAVPYASPRTIATLPDYHAFVVRTGGTRPNAVRLCRAIAPPTRKAAPLPVWDAPVVRWSGAEVDSAIAEEAPEAAPKPQRTTVTAAPVDEPSRDRSREPDHRPSLGRRRTLLPGGVKGGSSGGGEQLCN
jgi:hypothetical protein